MNTMLKWAMVGAAGYAAYKASAALRARGTQSGNSLGLAPEDLSATRYNASGINGLNDDDVDASIDSGVYPTSADKRFGSSSSAAAI